MDFYIADNKEFDFNIMKEFSKDFIDIIYQKYGLQVEVKNLKANKTDDIIQKWATKIFMPLPKEQRTPVINIEIASINSYKHIPMETIKITKK